VIHEKTTAAVLQFVSVVSCFTEQGL